MSFNESLNDATLRVVLDITRQRLAANPGNELDRIEVGKIEQELARRRSRSVQTEEAKA